MKEYLSHTEHLSNILDLVNNPGLMEEITAREKVSDIFLPALHLAELYGFESRYCFYLAIGWSFREGDRADSDWIRLSSMEKRTLRSCAPELFTPDCILRERILDYLVCHDKVLSRPWLTYCHKGMYPGIISTEAIKELYNYTQTLLEEEASHIIWVYGRRGSGRKTTVLEACNLPVFLVDVPQLESREDIIPCIEEIVTEIKLHGGVLCLCDGDTLFAGNALSRMVLNLIRPVSRVVYAVCENPPPPMDTGDFSLIQAEIPMPDPALSLRLWDSYTRDLNIDTPSDVYRLARLFRFTPLQIKTCAENFRRAGCAKGGHTLKAKELEDICRKCGGTELPFLGKAAAASFTWEDIVLPSDVKSLLEALVNRVRNHEKVYREWGFGGKTPYGRGTAVLFEGAPGTGKTMTAYALAARLGMPLYRVDISAVMSKYIGETEKNLQNIFMEAGRNQCVLFFDEADAIFSKRTEITDARDRYSNLEVAFLLQKLEEHSGLTILASNLARNLDEAFKRRLQFIIRFPFPDKDLREQIWRSSFPENAPLAPGIDFAYLSERYSMNGSGIKNAVLAAAFEAAAKNIPIDMDGIAEACRMEGLKSGIAAK